MASMIRQPQSNHADSSAPKWVWPAAPYSTQDDRSLFAYGDVAPTSDDQKGSVRLSLSDLVPERHRAKLRTEAKAWAPSAVAPQTVIRPPPGLSQELAPTVLSPQSTTACSTPRASRFTSPTPTSKAPDYDRTESDAGASASTSAQSDVEDAPSVDEDLTPRISAKQAPPEGGGGVVRLSLAEAIKVKLNCGARPWQPSGPSVTIPQQTTCPPKSMRGASSPCLPSEVYAAFQGVFLSGYLVMKTFQSVGDVHRNESGSKWSLVGKVQRVPIQQFQLLLTIIQRAFLQAAEQSRQVYIIGYEAAPFTPISTGRGFRVQLAMVQDESVACWDLLTTGVCCRGSACHWRHPSWQVTVEVSVIGSQTDSL